MIAEHYRKKVVSLPLSVILFLLSVFVLSTERPESLDKAGFVLAGIDEKSLLQAVDTAIELHQNGDYGTPVPTYTDENVSIKMVKLIQSYTGVVNKMVWRKRVKEVNCESLLKINLC